jgi:hypothetical protein
MGSVRKIAQYCTCTIHKLAIQLILFSLKLRGSVKTEKFIKENLLKHKYVEITFETKTGFSFTQKSSLKINFGKVLSAKVSFSRKNVTTIFFFSRMLSRKLVREI